jgi:hypothetical protein
MQRLLNSFCSSIPGSGIYASCSKLYTSSVYGLFRKEVSKSTFYTARVQIENKEFDVVHVKPDRKLPWGREKFSVIINHDKGRYDCECGLYNHFGILCSHAIRVSIKLLRMMKQIFENNCQCTVDLKGSTNIFRL